jgi:hypothetical protein
MSEDKPMLELGRYEELALSELAGCPVLAQCHAAWVAAGVGGYLPASLDLSVVPAETLPYTMLLDYLPAAGDVRVRIAGTYVGEHSSFRDSGRGLRGFFNETDAAIVYASLVRIAAAKTPSLARRDYVTIEGSRYSYTRLIMPLAADGHTVSGFFKTIEPASLHIE